MRRLLLAFALVLTASPVVAQRIDGGVRINGASQATAVLNPIFTGQFTVNGSLCAAGQVLQGGSPTTCTATLTLGAATTVPGTLALAKGVGGGALWTLASAATSNWTLTGAAVAPAQGDLATFSNATGQMASVADVATGQVLTSGGVNLVPVYSANPSVSSIITPTVKPSADSTTAITIANAAGTGEFVFDTINSRLAIGKATAPGDLAEFIAGANSEQGLSLTNTMSGTGATAHTIYLAGTSRGILEAFSQGYTTSGQYVQNSMLLESSNGLQLSARGANSIRSYVNDALALTLSGTALNLATGVALQYNGNAPATATVGPSSPTGTASTTLVMAGLAGSVTTRTGRILLCMSGYLTDNSANDGTKAQISYGTGAAPVNGAALTGTQVGPVQQFNASTLAAGASAPYGACWIVTGLSAGTAYWFDTAFAAITGGTGSLGQASMTANDIP